MNSNAPSSPIRINAGPICITPAARDALQPFLDTNKSTQALLARHLRGDWGDLSEDDWKRNDQDLATGDRVLSAYRVSEEVTVWIVSDAADESGERVTTILLPEDY